MYKRYVILSGLAAVVGCSIFGSNSNNNVPTIPLPPKKMSESDAVMPANPGKISGVSSAPIASGPISYSHQRTIEENRSNGQVTQIKVDSGSALPDYYMYPSQQQDLNTNGTPDKYLSTPSWQISW